MGRAKPYYKNIKTGNYGCLEAYTVDTRGGQSNAYRSVRLLIAVDGGVELSSVEERVLDEDLVEVSPQEVQEALLGR
ncbi:hypothetical protein H1Q63_22100 [Desmonostoc muscorum CCALA 125]|nr:hypothetical protein [Desmonostoc muscorum CCALA 125]